MTRFVVLASLATLAGVTADDAPSAATDAPVPSIGAVGVGNSPPSLSVLSVFHRIALTMVATSNRPPTTINDGPRRCSKRRFGRRSIRAEPVGVRSLLNTGGPAGRPPAWRGGTAAGRTGCGAVRRGGSAGRVR